MLLWKERDKHIWKFSIKTYKFADTKFVYVLITSLVLIIKNDCLNWDSHAIIYKMIGEIIEWIINLLNTLEREIFSYVSEKITIKNLVIEKEGHNKYAINLIISIY